MHMKKLLFTTLVLLCSVGAFSQKVNVVKNDFPVYQIIVDVDGENKKDIYDKVVKWAFYAILDYNLPSGTDFITADEENNEKATMHAISKFSYRYEKFDWEGRLNFTVNVDIKDEKFRATVEFTDSWSELGKLSTHFRDLQLLPDFEAYEPFFDKAKKIKNDLFGGILDLFSPQPANEESW